MDERVTDLTEPVAARVPNLGRRIASRSAGLTVRRSETLAGAVAGRRTSRTVADIVPLTIARRPPRPMIAAAAAPQQTAVAMAPSAPAPERSDTEFSDFAYRWMFGDGEVQGIPFADGAGLAVLAAREGPADEDTASPDEVESSPALAPDLASDTSAERAALPGIPRGRVQEISQYRLSRTPPPVASTEPLRHVDASASSATSVATVSRAIEEFGPAAYRGPSPVAPASAFSDTDVAPTPYDRSAEVGSPAVASVSEAPREPRERVPMQALAGNADVPITRIPLRPHRRRSEIPLTYVAVEPEAPARPAPPPAAKSGAAPRSAAKPTTSRPASTKNTAKKRPSDAKKKPPTAKGGTASRAAAARSRPAHTERASGTGDA